MGKSRNKSEVRQVRKVMISSLIMTAQSRVKIDESVVERYVEDLKRGVIFPPVVVYQDGKNLFLADGFHRIAAAVKAELTSFPAIIVKGTERDAMLYSVGANSTHGLPRTNEDKRHAVMMLLNDPEWGSWSANEIAKQCKVSDTFVGKIMNSLSPTSNGAKKKRKFTRAGKVHVQDVDKIGKSRKASKSPYAEVAAQDEPKQIESPDIKQVSEDASGNVDLLNIAVNQLTPAEVDPSIDSECEVTPPADPDDKIELIAKKPQKAQSRFPEMFLGKVLDYVRGSAIDDRKGREMVVYLFDPACIAENVDLFRTLCKNLGGTVLATSKIGPMIEYKLEKISNTEIDAVNREIAPEPE